MIAPLPCFVRPQWLAALAMAIAACPALAFVPAGGTAAASRWQLLASGEPGVAGDPIQLTWSFVPDGTAVRRADNPAATKSSDLIAKFDAAFGAGPGGSDLTQRPWFTYFDQAFSRWSELSGVTYIYEPNDTAQLHGSGVGLTGVRGDVRIGGIGMDGVGGTLAYNYFATDGGDMAIDTDDLAGILGDSANDYRLLRNTIMHEAGHGLGLDHATSSNANFLLEPTIDSSIDGPQHDDLRGIHWFYGDALEKAPAGRNETAALASPLGYLEVGAPLTIGAGGNGALIDPTETDFVSIANENDIDFFSFTIDEPTRLTVSMTPRGATYNQSATVFTTTTTNDLSLALFATDGVTLLAEAALGAAGVVETIADYALHEAGTYFARVRGPIGPTEQVVQFYQLDLSAASLLPPLSGDFNSDGIVDAADYTIWRDQDGQSLAAYTGADHTGDGLVDGADFALWQTHYGQTLSSLGVAVPEPTALVLAFVAMCRPRRRQPYL
ncbi:matrixin family metalloprotease [Botrimarina mediterranea]|uniref:Matrixin n=1 Tax=Botrimarina mediterranea TaxID=2528022 RepID=A0A518KDF3_9BACT|nr:matrixin family metalloprotease [Botrimarina mediterranea]QDV75832.1 Matrixin [Botrimarina mediterranea]QDV80429.1 Matrixin [Planctomycetes bacterium K2D]